jgi:hypothetical protein
MGLMWWTAPAPGIEVDGARSRHRSAIERAEQLVLKSRINTASEGCTQGYLSHHCWVTKELVA